MQIAWLWLVLALVGSSHIDPASRIEFTLRTRWGQALQGRFPQVEGRIDVGEDGHRRVRFRLATASVEIVDHPRYTTFARGPDFFDVAHHPQVEFVSDPYTPQLLLDGGALDGELRIRGVARRERFVLEPSRCAQPGRECDIVAHGSVRRSDYGLDGWTLALRERVRFALRVRTREAPP